MPPLMLHNTFSGKVEEFVPLSKKEVRMYNCGPTPYDQQHIGNLFPPIIGNILRRTLETWGYTVDEVNNITDFGHISEDDDSEDKMTRALRRDGMEPTLTNMRTLAEKYAQLFFDDLPLVGVDPTAVRYPRASDYITDQIAVIKTLEQKGYAYRISDGVYYDVSRFKNYGKLGSISLEGLKAGVRVQENKEKHTPYDFALWKLDKKLGWKSPWGLGFPGWHTECIAMIFSLLGRQIDIHMGGVDLIPTHHNNEIAQAEAITKKQFVRYWVHNAHITIDGKKISKSLGNTVYLSQLREHGLDPRAFRYWCLMGHYRTQMNFTWQGIEGADAALARLRRLYLELPPSHLPPDEKFLKDFYAAMADDLDTSLVLASVWELVRNPAISPAVKKVSLTEADKILGLGLGDPVVVAKVTVVPLSDLPEQVLLLVDQREQARRGRDFPIADNLRAQIEDLGYLIKDTPEGQKVFKK